MNESYPSNYNSLALLPVVERYQRRQLLKVFWVIAIGLLFFEFRAETDSLLSKVAAIIITVAAIFPSYLWCSGRAFGMPIFPLFAFTYTWTHGLPLVVNHPIVSTYSPDSHLFAGIATAGFLTIGTLVWFKSVKSPPPLPKHYRALNSKKGNLFFLLIMALAVLFNLSKNGGWLLLDGGIFAVIRGTVLGLTVLASFVLTYQLGNRTLPKHQSQLFVILLIAYMVTDAVALLVVGAASTFMVSTSAFIIGRKKLPIISILVVTICLSVLHQGKDEMRHKYWFKNDEPTFVQPLQYADWYNEWIGYSLERMRAKDDIYTSSKSEEKSSFVERSSVIQMLLLAQQKSPEPIPYLYGETYAIIPQLLIPRFLNPNKIQSHEGTSILSVHYGLQRREDTFGTKIGWGLLAESYGNFGLLGCVGLGIILGNLYGKITRWSMNAPILSVQSLFSVLLLAFSFQSEFSAGVYVSALFQSGLVLVGIMVVLMKKQKVPQFPVYYS
ncbi:O-antigen polysaccharide polymerase Wzy [Anabaena sp. UHCC 0399]|uniref:O-antigen polysaccharide polymerase Wzy n=1 Tax=Anabaena sp. UHCC 0399 TaxID=3110238 RepID=UPI002B20B678|nr:O-antigen polysaccharide polymerase Wzy [Anabaena sp. UHCC 0399]MEA5566124.1 O-antigen polysaccharide polymerase Wzy [Anabaena sp. UHCC 0399]